MINRILLVEDDPDLREETACYLRDCGWEVTEADSVAQMKAHLTEEWHILILDLGLPDGDGMAICQQIREYRPATGLLVLTGRSSLEAKVHGLQQGADAYMVKPVNPQELDATLQSNSRRWQSIKSTSAISLPVSGAPSHTLDAWRLDSQRGYLYPPKAPILTSFPPPDPFPAHLPAPLHLTYNETRILTTLAQAGMEVIERRRLVEALGHKYESYDLRRLEALISRLRRKLREAQQAELIRTAHGYGYGLDYPVQILNTH